MLIDVPELPGRAERREHVDALLQRADRRPHFHVDDPDVHVVAQREDAKLDVAPRGLGMAHGLARGLDSTGSTAAQNTRQTAGHRARRCETPDSQVTRDQCHE